MTQLNNWRSSGEPQKKTKKAPRKVQSQIESDKRFIEKYKEDRND